MYKEDPLEILDDDHDLTQLNKWFAKRNFDAKPLKEKYADTKFKLKDLSSFVDTQQLEIDDLREEVLALYEEMKKLKDECENKDTAINLLMEENRSSYRLKDDFNARIIQLQPCIAQSQKQAEVIEKLRNEKATFSLHSANLKEKIKECKRDNEVLTARSNSLFELNEFYVKHHLDECDDNSTNYSDLQKDEAAFFNAHLEKEEGRNEIQELNMDNAR